MDWKNFLLKADYDEIDLDHKRAIKNEFRGDEAAYWKRWQEKRKDVMNWSNLVD